jgi:hypothetical protein
LSSFDAAELVCLISSCLFKLIGNALSFVSPITLVVGVVGVVPLIDIMAIQAAFRNSMVGSLTPYSRDGRNKPGNFIKS